MASRFRIVPTLLPIFLVLVGYVVLRHIQPDHSRHTRIHPQPHELGRRPGTEPHSREPKSQREIPASCDQFGTTCGSRYFLEWTPPGDGFCTVGMRHGYPVPDPKCTPGGINPSVTSAVLTDPAWRTRCIRNCETSEAQKHVAYAWYGIRKPSINSGDHQVCELDHLVPLELGGADGLGNIWPECGPDAETLHRRYFKIKDRVENFLADQVRAGKMPLHIAQRGIAEDWTQYLEAANRYCDAGGRC